VEKEKELLEVAEHFDIDGYPGVVKPFGSGHIHDTYQLEAYGTFVKKYVLQRVNHFVFKNPEMVQNNISKILNYLNYKVRDLRWEWISDLEIISNVDGSYCHKDGGGDYWRCFGMIHNTHTLDKVENPEQAYQGALAYGHFLARLDGFDASQLGETIPGFRDISWRMEQLEDAKVKDEAGRVREVGPELEWVQRHSSIPSDYLAIVNKLPARVAHNDTKITNVLMDNTTRRGVCVIDLDTVMLGNLITEYGDMVRSFTVTGEEDATQKEHFNCQVELFESLTKGFSKAVSGMITDLEKETLLLGAELVIYMQAIRFFADYLNGDIYYKTEYAEQNLLRTRNQLGLLDSVVEQEERLQEIIKESF